MVNQWKDGKRQEENKTIHKKGKKRRSTKKAIKNEFFLWMPQCWLDLQSFFSEACRRSKQRRSSRYAFINFTSEQAAKRFQKRHTWQQKFIQQNIRWISCEGSNDLMPCWQVAWCISCSWRRRSSLALSHNCFSCHVELQCTIQKVKVRRDEASKHDHPQNKKLIGKDRSHEIKLNF